MRMDEQGCFMALFLTVGVVHIWINSKIDQIKGLFIAGFGLLSGVHKKRVW